MVHEIDVLVGNAVRRRRVSLGVTQDKLAKSLNITFQQVQKYETGVNRIGASRLYEIASILNSDISYFFENIDNINGGDILSLKNDGTSTRETMDLIRSYSEITDINIRKNILVLVQSLSKKEAEEQL